MPGIGESYLVSRGLVEPCREVLDRMYKILCEGKPDVGKRELFSDVTARKIFKRAAAEIGFVGELADINIYCKVYGRRDGVGEYLREKMRDESGYMPRPVPMDSHGISPVL
jgi:hypothetical protein